MNVTSKGRYALRVMLDLAQHPDEGYISLKTIADRQRVSMKYLEIIVRAYYYLIVSVKYTMFLLVKFHSLIRTLMVSI